MNKNLRSNPSGHIARAVLLSAGWKEMNRQFEQAQARVARLEGALARYGQHENGCPKDLSGVVYPHSEFRRRPCSCGFATLLASQQKQKDDTEWQPVQRAAQLRKPIIQGDAAVTSETVSQSDHDAAYWRKRAEAAEARAVREGRDE